MDMGKIALIVIGLIILYGATIVVPVACDDSALSKMGPCYWFYNQPIIFYGALVIVLIVLNLLIKLIKKKNDK